MPPDGVQLAWTTMPSPLRRRRRLLALVPSGVGTAASARMLGLAPDPVRGVCGRALAGLLLLLPCSLLGGTHGAGLPVEPGVARPTLTPPTNAADGVVVAGEREANSGVTRSLETRDARSGSTP